MTSQLKAKLITSILIVIAMVCMYYSSKAQLLDSLGTRINTKSRTLCIGCEYVDIWRDSILVRMDTVRHISQVYNYYKQHCMYFQVDDNPPQLVMRNEVFTVWSTHFELVVTRKKYKRIYSF